MSSEIVQSEIPAQEQRFLAGMEPRIARSMCAIGVCGTAALWLARGAPWAAAFAAGALLSALNFRWMKSGVNALAEQFSSSGSEPELADREAGSSAAVARFVLRYALIGLTGYAIFRSSAVSLPAFLAGLFVAIAAVFVEVSWQVWLALFKA